MIYLYNRKTKTLEIDSQYGRKYLTFLYTNVLGRLILKIIINPVFSKIYGIYNNTFFSRKKIQRFIEKYNIDINEYEKKDYKCFNDFFIRKKVNLKISKERSILISPANSKLLVYNIEKGLEINIKNSTYTLNELLDEDYDLNDYIDGKCLIFRLSMNDYHRYCFIDNGIVEKAKCIKGKLHTVSSISSKNKVYSQNSRICNFLKTENFGSIIYVEVGALLVGKINNSNVKEYKKGDEKGFFELGGSTIILLIKNNVKIDVDIIENSQKGIETIVSYGERIGELK